MKHALQSTAVIVACVLVFALLAFLSQGGGATPSPWAVSSSADDATTIIARENAEKGTGAWRLGGVRSSHPVEGFASSTSIAAGETIDLFVRTRAARFRVDVYRMGYYAGAGGRAIASFPDMPGNPQSPCALSDDGRRTLACRWQRSLRIDSKAFWVSGVYLAKLSASDRTQSWIPFVVREASPRAPILVQTSVTTWQAYNAWGGRSSYSGPCEKRQARSPSAGSSRSSAPSSPALRAEASHGPSLSPLPTSAPPPTIIPSAPASPTLPPATRSPSPTSKPPSSSICGSGSRSRATSYDRPYRWPGDGQFFRFEFPMVMWLESRHMPVAYSSGLDLHQGLSALEKRKVFLSVGHDEYYSTPMRRSLEGALGRGTSLAFFGANDMFRHIRFESSDIGRDRVQVGYKSAAEDPLTGRDNASVTGQWREWPLRDPEQKLLGSQYECNPVRADWIATGSPAWLFAGTGFNPGDGIDDLVGYEYDRLMPGYPAPMGVTVVARSPVRCGGRRSESHSTFYIAPSGAAVFNAGTLWFPCALGPGGCNHPNDSHPKPDPRLQRLVDNLLRSMLEKRFG